MGDSDQLQGKDNFTLGMVKHLEKTPEILYPCILSENLYQLPKEGPLHPSSTQLSLTCLGVSGLLQEVCLVFLQMALLSLNKSLGQFSKKVASNSGF